MTELVQKRAVIIFAEYSPAGCNNPRGRIQFTTEKMFFYGSTKCTGPRQTAI